MSGATGPLPCPATPHWFHIPFGAVPDAERVVALFGQLGTTDVVPQPTRLITAYDSADRRLAGMEQGLIQTAAELRCIHAGGWDEVPWNTAVGPIPARDLPASLAERLAEPLGDRLLLPLGTVRLDAWTGTMPGAEAGVSLVATILRADEERWAGFLAVDAPATVPFPSTLTATLLQAGLIPSDRHPLLAFIDQLVGPYPRIPALPAFTDATEPALVAMRRLVAGCLVRLRLLEPGIIDDLDPSFLHQYRVTLRTTRSLCKLMAEVFDGDTALRLTTDLGDLARAGNLLRDLDVHLVGDDDPAAGLPPHAVEGLSFLINHLSSRRQEAQRQLAARLRSPEHAAHLDDLERLVHGTDAEGAGPAARLPIARVVRDAGWRAWRTVRRRARSIGAETGDGDIHRLRIRVKRLRYLLDVFGRLVAPPAEVLRLQERIKDLQAELGDYNDTVNQLQLLLDLGHAPDLPSPAVFSVGIMAGMLTARRREQRADLEKVLTQATGKAIRRAYESCFCPDEEH